MLKGVINTDHFCVKKRKKVFITILIVAQIYSGQHAAVCHWCQKALHKSQSAIHMNPSVSSLHSCLKKKKEEANSC